MLLALLRFTKLKIENRFKTLFVPGALSFRGKNHIFRTQLVALKINTPKFIIAT